MPISFKSLQGSSIFYQPIEASGTYALSTTLEAGVYSVTGDSSQSLIFYVKNSSGYQFPLELRGGRGRVYIPISSTQIVAPAGTYPIILGFEKINISVPVTPAATFAWDASNINTAKGTFTFSMPSGSAQTRVYWEDGTSEYITSGQQVTPKSLVYSMNQQRFPLIVYKTNIGVEGLGQVLNTGMSTGVTTYASFLTSGSWTAPTGVTNVKLALLAGGGGGGNGGNSAGSGGGGGAGGLIYDTVGISVTPGTSYPVVIGAGGASNTNGSNSTFAGLTAIGGGGGRYYSNGNAGGSGGGAGSYGSGTVFTGGAGTTGQGNKGGDYTPGGQYMTVGGGGYGSAGSNSYSGSGGQGGTGIDIISIYGSTKRIAGGGGGGQTSGYNAASGTDGGGAGGTSGVNGGVGNAGTANTGGGGGGGSHNGGSYAGGTGGSGALYITYVA